MFVLFLDKSANAQLVLAIAGRMMHDKFGVYECTVQIENYVDEMDDCVQCQEPSDWHSWDYLSSYVQT